MVDISLESPWDERRRRICLAPGVIHLNAGSCSPTCRPALDRALALTRQQAEDPVDFIFRRAPLLLETTRASLARMAGCAARDLVLFTNATFALNTAVRALPLAPGDEVVLSDQEYHHYGGLWRRLAEKAGAKLVHVTLPMATDDPRMSPESLVELFRAKLTPKTKVLHFSHVTSRTGLALPARALCAMAKERGILSVVDGAHAIGLVPLTLETLGADFYAANVHKWLMGTPGAGFLYVAAQHRLKMEPLVSTGFRDFNEAEAEHSIGYGGPAKWQYAHEYQGTRDLTPLLAAPAAVEFYESIGLAAITERTAALAALCRTRLTGMGLTCVSPEHAELATCMTTFTVPVRVDTVKAWVELRKRYNLEVLFTFLEDGTPLLRVSTAWFNAVEEVERLAEVLQELDWQTLV